MESTTTHAPLTVGIGAYVELELIDDQGGREQLAVDIVTAQSADLAQGFLGANTPLARAMRGQAAGSEVPYLMGDIRSVRILRVTPSQTIAPADAQERREAVLQKALSDAERTNAEIFASSFSGKWGDYDPQGMAAWNEP
ncbi:MAG TPA: GreA/GreB family elongation factor [Anaerolineae bacterium]|nr:GreA/GreB family elongation factor [Anaerolineae bacterium]